jgi:hypothetical protein
VTRKRLWIAFACLIVLAGGLHWYQAHREAERKYAVRLEAYMDLWRGSSLVKICGTTKIYRLRDGRHVTSWPPETGTPVDVATIC